MEIASLSNLPQELLEFILEKLENGTDVIRCGLLSVSWRIAVNEVYHKFIPSMLITSNEDTTCLFNVSTEEQSNILLQDINGRYICGSTNKWLVTIDSASPHRIRLLNPLTRTQVDLPCITTFEFPHLLNLYPITWTIKRVITSASPLDLDCLVVAIYGIEGKVAFCRIGDGTWSDIESARGIVDIMFYKGQLYATDSFGDIQCWQLDPNPVKLWSRIMDHGDKFYESGQKYLMESLSGDFWVVHRNCDWEDSENGGYDLSHKSLTTSFKVFKLDMCAKEWSEVENWDGQALFLGGGNSSTIVSTSRALLRSNSIYFVEGY
ncbi:F-box domain-containing protein/DUF295 domain-containing protein [Cephalotus follicularis]|uniref:F-box domain-containing protein/DUF295 domain-containing protein n=1 Tax=Cephalotus follicularis TaxID=3775 RepID=A0A1Q3D059_CEPFO|nr:F-box domain-containing protein/DUF295 domain-containing protein [Cephalotus follicularis]